ncbi:hypothetical protein HY643_03110 [Candidatus Woesearchaeota archaeon]|nr:hypothetical protein [Candidatus Woesearchaeota archaeon]
MIRNIKEKLIGATGSVSGATSILGSWQVCHNICLGIVALLSMVGIAVAGMPLLFLTKIAVPLWVIAVIFLIITVVVYFKKKCISKNLIILNSGFIIAGVPFQPLQKFSTFFWIFGGLIVLTAIILFAKDKFNRR